MRLPSLPLRSLRQHGITAALAALVLVLAGADGCSSDPNVNGARLEIQNENWVRANELLDAALAEDPNNVDALVLKAQVLRSRAEDVSNAAERRPLVTEMVTTLQRIESVAPGNATALRERQVAYVHEMQVGATVLRGANGDAAALANATGAFENAVALSPDSSGAHYNLGLARLIQGQTSQAIPAMERAIQLGENDRNAFVYLSRAYLSESRGADAVALLERARTQFEGDAEASAAIQAELLNAYAATGQGDRALGEYERAVQMNPDNALYRYNYGSTLLELSRYDEAIEQLTRATQLDPSNQNAHFNLGAAYTNKAADMGVQLREASDADAPRIRSQRDALLRQSVPHLVEARRLAEASGEGAQPICQALLRAYTTLEGSDSAQAREVAACAGVNMN